MPFGQFHFLIDLADLGLAADSPDDEVSAAVDEYFDFVYTSRFCDPELGWKTYALVLWHGRVVAMPQNGIDPRHGALLRELAKFNDHPILASRFALQNATRAVALDMGLAGSRVLAGRDPGPGDTKLAAMDEWDLNALISEEGPLRLKALRESMRDDSEVDRAAVARLAEALRLYESSVYWPFSVEVEEPHVYRAFDLRAAHGQPHRNVGILVAGINFNPPDWPLPPLWRD